MLDRTELHAENGLIENTQVVLLVMACLGFLAPIALETRSDKLILLFFALLCYTFVLRELDVEKFSIPKVLIFIGSGAGHKTIVGVGFFVIVSYALFHFSYYKKAAIKFLSSRPGILMLLGSGFLFIGDFFEKNYGIIHHEYFEEMFELCGYALILLAACATNVFFTPQIQLKPHSVRTKTNF